MVKKPQDTNLPKTDKLVQTEKNVEKELTSFHDKLNSNENQTKVDTKAMQDFNSNKDSTKKESKLVNSIYPYWVYIMKDGERVNDFGVRDEDIDGVRMLIRKEKIGGETKVLFCELYPEPAFDLNVINDNKIGIKNDLNRLKQIEKKLIQDEFDKKITISNYDISDVRKKILEKEIHLNAIKYGKTFRYFQKFRPDGIKALFYELENSGLRLKKEVKEAHLFTEASENKKLESAESRRKINAQLKAKDEKDWKKIALSAIWLLFTFGYMYEFFEFATYNKERAFEDTEKKLDAIILEQTKLVGNIIKSIQTRDNSQVNFEKGILDFNQNMMDQCIDRNLFSNNKALVN